MKPGVDYVCVGVGVLVVKDGKVLMQKRKGAAGAGTWALPGGHLELKESFFDCAKREIMEEHGVEIRPLKVVSVNNNIGYGRHSVTVGVLAEITKGVPKIMEPDKCEEIKWFDINKLPKNMFDASEWVIAHYKGEPLG
ncbi:MAG: NUDIX domain-containing protein [Candidatus Nanoarchaeia archaeon]|nr:NUDIX domain-containing protein [Candidatus Nanoarchaeia archaeon]MDD5239757.1 NUDIX domain-containing protein [Candidatus Nanoarchaeia archaeon]